MIMRPGPGWTHIENSAVWAHSSGARIHLAGFIRLPDGRRKALTDHCGGELGRRLVEINGTRRGLMVWAMNEMGQV